MPPTARCVLLLHTLPDGSCHHDLMLERTDAPHVTRLITFRILTRPDLPDAPDTFNATRLPEHRADFLDYEGPLTSNRGSVRRLARGLIPSLTTTPHALELTLDWGAGPRRWLATALKHADAPRQPPPTRPPAPAETFWLFRQLA